MVYDSIIIGSGIAGASAAMNLKIRKKSFLIFGHSSFNSKAIRAEQILNYPGLPAATGQQLSDAIFNHLDAMDITVTEQKINGVFQYDGVWNVTSGSTIYQSRSVIIATGVAFSNPIEGEEAHIGMGVSYCATCDGMLYKGRNVAVIGTSSDSEDEMYYLAEVAAHVDYVPLYTLRDGFVIPANVTIHKAKPKAVLGEGSVTGLRLESEEELAVDGIFILKDAISPANLIYGIESDGRHIIVDRQMRTNLEGCFACGDCTGRPYQYIKSAGEGNVAAHSVIDYLAHLKKEEASVESNN